MIIMWRRFKTYILENKKTSYLFIGLFSAIAIGGIVFSVLFQPKYYTHGWKEVTGELESGNYALTYVSYRVDIIEPKFVKEGNDYKTVNEKHANEIKDEMQWTVSKVLGGYTISFDMQNTTDQFYLSSTHSLDKGLCVKFEPYVWNVRYAKNNNYIIDDKHGYYLTFNKSTDIWCLNDTYSEDDSGYNNKASVITIYKISAL